MSHLMNESVNNEGVCRTAPATPGLLITQQHIKVHLYQEVTVGPESNGLYQQLTICLQHEVYVQEIYRFSPPKDSYNQVTILAYTKEFIVAPFIIV